MRREARSGPPSEPPGNRETTASLDCSGRSSGPLRTCPSQEIRADCRKRITNAAGESAAKRLERTRSFPSSSWGRWRDETRAGVASLLTRYFVHTDNLVRGVRRLAG